MPEETALIEPMPVQRDELGMWTHPAWPDDGEESAILKSWFTERGLEYSLIEMESDGPEQIVEDYFEQGLVDCTPWMPTTPAGDGWFIFSIHDTEDGPICVWVRYVPSLQLEVDAVAAGKEFCGACGDGCGSCKIAEESPQVTP